jgi:hypothetical protein
MAEGNTSMTPVKEVMMDANLGCEKTAFDLAVPEV